MPMDETLAVAAIDLGGRPYAVVDLQVRAQTVGDLPAELVQDFFEGFAQRRARQRAREGAVRPIESSPDRGGLQGVRPRAARRLREGPPAGAHAAVHQGPAVIRRLVDYGAGNLTSVVKAFAAVGRRRACHDRRRRRPRAAPRRSSCRRRPLRRDGVARRATGGARSIQAHRRRRAAARHLPRAAVAVRRQRGGAGRRGPRRRCPGAASVLGRRRSRCRTSAGTRSTTGAGASRLLDGVPDGASGLLHALVRRAGRRGDASATTTHGVTVRVGRRTRPRVRRAVPPREVRPTGLRMLANFVADRARRTADCWPSD